MHLIAEWRGWEKIWSMFDRPDVRRQQPVEAEREGHSFVKSRMDQQIVSG
jgi:hypothetical protein